MILELFKQLTKIPRCSGTHQPFIDFITSFAKKYDYICKIDEAKNILCYKENQTSKNQKATICLQSHYDMVCLEDGKIPEIIELDGFLTAKNSTLGADNGIGCAYMLALMMENINAEFLFTSDEEIGLIGTNNLALPLNAAYMLNLDSEEEGRICIGCAGGVDIFCNNNNSKIVQNKQNKTLYEIEIDELDGGHSGVDIDKNIPNAIKLVVQTIKECDGDLLDINGGERINSIPKKCKAIISSTTKPIASHENMKITRIETASEHYKKFDSQVIDFLYNFQNGVREINSELHIPQTSINLSIIKTNIDGIQVHLSARSMDNDELQEIKNMTSKEAINFGFEVDTNGKYPAWKPNKNIFSDIVLEIYKKHDANVSFEAVHAGLECAIFKEKYPQMFITSIGPNIYFPHGNREKCEIASVYKVFEVLKEIIKIINKN
ncbi:MAG: M20/M25/M40 family metallo-hydrolase [Arcobacter sp.]|nr:M20/M25/M40 family metallo-hydrolase [Arcobacter sp.]